MGIDGECRRAGAGVAFKPFVAVIVTTKMLHFVTICSCCPPDVSVVIGPPNCVAHIVIVVREIYKGAPDEVWIHNWRRIRRIPDRCG